MTHTAALRVSRPRSRRGSIALAAAFVFAGFGLPLVRAEDLPPPVPAPAADPLALSLLTRELSTGKTTEARARAARRIGALGPSAEEAVPFLVRALSPRVTNVSADIPSSPDAVGWAAAEALAEIGPAASLRLFVALRDPSPQVREAAAYALGLMRPLPDDAVIHLVRALSDGQRTVRAMAAQSLGRIGAPAVEKVSHALATGSIASRESAARALSLVDPKDIESAIPALSRAMSTPEASVRTAVVHALGRAPADSIDSATALVAALRDRDPAVRAAAAASLDRVGRAEVWTAAALVDAFGDADVGVRIQAAKSVASRGPYAERIVTPLARLLTQDDQVAMAAASSLGRFGAAAENAVLPLLDVLRSDREPLVRVAAAEALGEIGPRASVAAAPLRRIAADVDEDPDVGDAAAIALVRIGR